MFVSTSRPVASILHADLDAFFASVEQRDDPALRGKPVIVGPGVVLAASYEARACGVRSAMGGTKARNLCPDAIVVSPRFKAYVEASREVFKIFEDTAPVVEAISIDEAFLDVRGLEHISGTAAQIAARLRARVREEVGLPISVGVATTKHLAKVASNEAKPDGLLVVSPGAELAFLHPLPVERLWGVGPATAQRLREHGIVTVGQLAGMPEAVLVTIAGRAVGRRLHAISHNRDPRRVRAGRGRRSIGSQSALGSRGRSWESLDTVAVGLVDRVARRMRKGDRVGRTVILRLRWGDFTRATRSKTLAHPTASTTTLLIALRALLAAEREMIARRGLTLLGVTITNLEHAGADVQLELPLDGTRAETIDQTMDAIRDRFGTTAVRRARLLTSGDRMSAWLMPGDAPDAVDDLFADRRPRRGRPGPTPTPRS
ncbi:DNA polymerase [Baekduia alba]|uniref:DNA polymerase IV n=1 Tax=Baekduia alba TaxID=2997333 RepID=UPI0032C476FF|nr:DNA polymerase [Baekduia alba]